VIPVCINRRENIDSEISAIKNYGANFSAINMEDIAAPSCFTIEGTLREQMNIPVFHDDQHGTAIVILAGLINGTKFLGKDLKKAKIVINGAGAAGISFARLAAKYGVEEVVLCDTHGAIYQGRPDDMNPIKEKISLTTNLKKIKGKLPDILPDADVFVGVSVGGALKPEWIKLMAPKPIVFGLANPDP
jgi:malate dehydrogenase (oxaloacetate-decarboxylating)